MAYSSKFDVVNIFTWRLASDSIFLWKGENFTNKENDNDISEKDIVYILSQYMDSIKQSQYKTLFDFYNRKKLISDILDKLVLGLSHDEIIRKLYYENRGLLDPKIQAEMFTNRVTETRNCLVSTLKNSALEPIVYDWQSQKRTDGFKLPVPPKPHHFTLLENANKNGYEPKFTLWDKISTKSKMGKIALAEKRYKERQEYIDNENMRLMRDNEAQEQDYQSKLSMWNEEKNKFDLEKQRYNTKLDSLYEAYKSGEQHGVEFYFAQIIGQIDLLEQLITNWEVSYDNNNETLIVNYQIPDKETVPAIKTRKYVKTRDEFSDTLLKETEVNDIYVETVYQLILRITNDLYVSDTDEIIKHQMVNMYYSGIDRRRGEEGTYTILSLPSERTEFLKLSIRDVNAKACFKSLGGASNWEYLNISFAGSEKLEKKIKELEKYEEIVDAKEEAKQIREKTRKKLDEAESYVKSAILFYHETMEQARKRADDLLLSVNEKLPAAQEILEKAEALQNIVNGYGEKYLIPGYSVFDELAYEYGFDESGKQLKLARERTRLMAEEGKAAACDYVEANRKITAINFITDAFNGKVDSILSSAKTDNASILIQKIKDAYWTVNSLGAAFRNARILEDYRDSRIDELKWLIRVNELIQRRKDEQRELREEERDAVRAKREAERELLKAQREIVSLNTEKEELAKKIREIDNDIEKKALIIKLRELEEKLREKDIIQTRAKSMAELTSVGNVYIISNIGSFGENVYKIGLTRRWDRDDRIRELYNASVPFPFEIHGWISSDKAPDIEKILHNKFAFNRVNKVNTFKEYFDLSLDKIKDAANDLGLNVEWTIAGRAREYEESLRITKQLEDGTLSKEEYLKRWQKNVQQQSDNGFVADFVADIDELGSDFKAFDEGEDS